MTTREAKKITFKHLLTNVMETDENDVLFRIFAENNITMIHKILTMSKEAIDLLKYEKNGVSISPPAHVLAKLHIIKAWNTHLLETHDLKIVDWNDGIPVNTDTFDEFAAMKHSAPSDVWHIFQ